MECARAAWERAMRLQEVMLKAISGELHWFRAAEILGIDARSWRRWRDRYERYGYDGLMDRRCGKPSVRRVPLTAVQAILRLYRERYRGFNVRHFHQLAQREHGLTLSYSFVKQALQTAGLVKKRRPCLIPVLDDATHQVLHAALYPSESTDAVMHALAAVFRTYGLPMALYTDRARWAFYTPRAKGPVDKTHLTQVGRALERLGIDHIPAYSPQARGRSERLNRTFQDRLVNELRVAGIATLAAANQYLRDVFVPHHNALFARPPRDPGCAFVPLGTTDLDGVLCHEATRVVARDNTVTIADRVLQIAPQPGRRSCAGLTVTVRRHLDGRFTIARGAQRLGAFAANGQPVEAAGPMDAKRTRPQGRGKRHDRFPQLPQPSISPSL
jgi:transposase InsO family protein